MAMLDDCVDDRIISGEPETPQAHPHGPQQPQQQQQQAPAPDPGPHHQAADASVSPQRELAITCQGTQGLLFLDPAKQSTKPQWLVRCSCPKCQDGPGFSDQGLVMGPSQFERHAGAGSSKKWKSSCRVADSDSGLCGRPVLAWLQQQGYEQTAAGTDRRQSDQRTLLLFQQQQLLLQLKLLIRDVPLLQLQLLPSSIGELSDSNKPNRPALKIPGNCYSPAWQLHNSYYQHLPAAVALLHSSSGSKEAKPRNDAQNLPPLPAAAAADIGPQLKVHQQTISHLAPGVAGHVKAKRARVLRDGALTVIPYGHDENQLWLQRVHTFIGAVRRVLGRRRCTVVWGGSVLDSVVGAFLTQAVSDVQSSTAFINLAATWPGPATLAAVAAAEGGGGVGAAAAGEAEVKGVGRSGVIAWHKRGPVGVGVDLVDWWSVMNAPQLQLEQALRGRGLHVMLSRRIQTFLRQLAADQRCVEELAPAAAAAASSGAHAAAEAADDRAGADTAGIAGETMKPNDQQHQDTAAPAAAAAAASTGSVPVASAAAAAAVHGLVDDKAEPVWHETPAAAAAAAAYGHMTFSTAPAADAAHSVSTIQAAAEAAVAASEMASPLTPSPQCVCSDKSSNSSRKRQLITIFQAAVDNLRLVEQQQQQQQQQQAAPQPPSTPQQQQSEFVDQQQQEQPAADACTTAACNSTTMAEEAAGGTHHDDDAQQLPHFPDLLVAGVAADGAGAVAASGDAAAEQLQQGSSVLHTTIVDNPSATHTSPVTTATSPNQTLDTGCPTAAPAASTPSTIGGSSIGHGPETSTSNNAAAATAMSGGKEQRPAKKPSTSRELKLLLQGQWGPVAVTAAATRNSRPIAAATTGAAAAGGVERTTATERDDQGLDALPAQQRSSPPGSPQVAAPGTPQPRPQQQRRQRRHSRSPATEWAASVPSTAGQVAGDRTAAAGGDGGAGGAGGDMTCQTAGATCLPPPKAARTAVKSTIGRSGSSRSRVVLTRSMSHRTTRSSSSKQAKGPRQLTVRNDNCAPSRRASNPRPPAGKAIPPGAGGSGKRWPASGARASTANLGHSRRKTKCGHVGMERRDQQQQQRPCDATGAAMKRLKSVRWADEQDLGPAAAAAAAAGPKLQQAGHAAAAIPKVDESANVCSDPAGRAAGLSDQPAAAAAAAAGLRRSSRPRIPSRSLAADFLDPSAAVAAASGRDHGPEGDQSRHRADHDTVSNNSDSDDDSADGVTSLSSDTTVTSESDISDDDGADMICSKPTAGGPRAGSSSSSGKAIQSGAAAPWQLTARAATAKTPVSDATRATAATAAATVAAKAAVAAVAAAAVSGSPVQPVISPLPTHEPTTTRAAVLTAEISPNTSVGGDHVSRRYFNKAAATQPASVAPAAVSTPEPVNTEAYTTNGLPTAATCSGSPKQQQQQQVAMSGAAYAGTPQNAQSFPVSIDGMIADETNLACSAGSAPSELAFSTPGDKVGSGFISTGDMGATTGKAKELLPEGLDPQPSSYSSQGSAGNSASRPRLTQPSSQPSSSSSSVSYIRVPDITIRTAASNNSSSSSSGSGRAPPKRLTLEWLRGCSVGEVRDLLSGVVGLGRKSIACVGLLTLGLRDFPVDVNVGRIAARLGWIPLQAAESLESLESYPAEPEVHKYLLDRLTRVTDLESLYELHYLAITLGKVLCTKQLPHCTACPLQHVCEYALSGGDKLQQGGPRRKVRVIRNTAAAAAGGGGGGGGSGSKSMQGSQQAMSTLGRTPTTRGKRTGAAARRKESQSPAPAAATAAWWSDPEIPWTYSSSRFRSDRTAAEYDLEDLDALFAAAPRQRRNARLFDSSAGGGSRAWGAAAAAAGLLDFDDDADQHMRISAQVIAGTPEIHCPHQHGDEPQQQQQQHQRQQRSSNPTCTEGPSLCPNPDQAGWEKLFEGLTSAAGNNCEQQQGLLKHQLLAGMSVLGADEALQAAAGSAAAAAVEGSSGVASTGTGTLLYYESISPVNLDKQRSSPTPPHDPTAQLQVPVATAAADAVGNLESEQEQQQGLSCPTLREQQEQAIFRLASIAIPPHCAVLPAVTAAGIVPDSSAAAANPGDPTAAAARGGGSPSISSSSSSNSWCWEVLGLAGKALGHHAQQQQQQQQQHQHQQLCMCVGADPPAESAIKAAYRQLAILLHPDKCQLPGAAAAFALVRRARTLALQAVAAFTNPAAAAATATTGGEVGDNGSRVEAGSPQQCGAPAAAAAAAGAATANLDVTIAATAAAGSSKTRRVAVGLQLTPAVMDLLDLPDGYLPPGILGESQMPLLLVVEVTQGAVQLAAAEQQRLAHMRQCQTQQQQQQQEEQQQQGEVENIKDKTAAAASPQQIHQDPDVEAPLGSQQAQQQQQQQEQQQQEEEEEHIMANTAVHDPTQHIDPAPIIETSLVSQQGQPEQQEQEKESGMAGNAADRKHQIHLGLDVHTHLGSQQAQQQQQQDEGHPGVSAAALPSLSQQLAALNLLDGGDVTAADVALGLPAAVTAGSAAGAAARGSAVAADAVTRAAVTVPRTAAYAELPGAAVAVPMLGAANPCSPLKSAGMGAAAVTATVHATAAEGEAAAAGAAGRIDGDSIGGVHNDDGEATCPSAAADAAAAASGRQSEEQLLCTEHSTAWDSIMTEAEDITLISTPQQQQQQQLATTEYEWAQRLLYCQQQQIQDIQMLTNTTSTATAAAAAAVAPVSSWAYHEQQQRYNMDWQQQQQQTGMSSLHYLHRTVIERDQLLTDWYRAYSVALWQQQQTADTATVLIDASTPPAVAAGWAAGMRCKAKHQWQQQQQQMRQPKATKPKVTKPRLVKHPSPAAAGSAAKDLAPGIAALPSVLASAAAATLAAPDTKLPTMQQQHIILAVPNCKLLVDQQQIAAAVAAAAPAAGSQASSSNICGVLLTPVLSALRGAFPLNGTYFQTNELFTDQRSLVAPLLLPDKLLQLIQKQLTGADAAAGGANTVLVQGQQQPADTTLTAPPAAEEGSTAKLEDASRLQWKHVYFGSSVSSICSGMSSAELSGVFQCGCVCIRSHDPDTGAVALKLPAYLAPAGE